MEFISNIDYKELFNIKNCIDLFLVFLFVYIVYNTLYKLRLLPLLFFSITITVIVFVAQFANLMVISWIFITITPYIFFVIFIVLQPELRSILLRLGNNIIFEKFFRQKTGIPIEEVLGGISTLISKGYGAIMIFTDKIDFYSMRTNGIPINADISKELLISIFNPKSPLHDGAVIIKSNKIISAANYLPLSYSRELKKTHGSRHRSALGTAEETDAFVVFISEEKKSINIAYLSTLYENIDIASLKSLLEVFNKRKLAEKSLSAFKKKEYQENMFSKIFHSKNKL